MRLFTPDDMIAMMNARLSALAQSHQATVDPIVLHAGTLMAHTHITRGGLRAHLQFPVEPIGTFDQHRTDHVIEAKFKQMLELIESEKSA